MATSHTPTETAARISASQRERWARVHALDHIAAATAFRSLVRSDRPDRDLLAALCQRALDTSPPEWRHVWERWSSALSNGHRIAFKTVPVRFILPPDPALIAEVEAALQGVTTP